MDKTGDREALIAAAVAGRPYAEIAALANVSISTVQRRLRDPGVLAEIREERHRQRHESLGRFTQLRSTCMERLALLIDDPDGALALRAIGLVLTASNRLETVHDVDQRLLALEEPIREDVDVNPDSEVVDDVG